MSDQTAAAAGNPGADAQDQPGERPENPFFKNNFPNESETSQNAETGTALRSPPAPTSPSPARGRGGQGVRDVGAHGDAARGGVNTSADNSKLQNEIGNESGAASQPRRKRGQRTKAGQAIASRNAIRHGIMSPHPVVIETMESIEDWECHRHSIVQHFAPVGALEAELANRLATILWRLRRVTRYESAVINFQVAETRSDLYLGDWYFAKKGQEVPEPKPQLVAAHKERRVIPNGEDVDKILKYEAHLHRQSLQLLHELEALQARRNGEQTPLARLDISAPPLS